MNGPEGQGCCLPLQARKSSSVASAYAHSVSKRGAVAVSEETTLHAH